MFSLALFGGNKIDANDLEPGERVVGLALFGGMELDFTAVPDPLVDLVLIALFGGVTVKVQPTQPVRLAGFSVFGGRDVEPRQLPAPTASAPSAASASVDDEPLPLEINAYAVFGGVNVKRAAATLAQ